ncbi:redoxin domain-containing protein [Stappia sp. GBMRC 2046]|uniref:Redoxin domain-containing protein n=1 Tax=Stappia sediminis TaxID=2692190 RepID=A0A7X3LTJ5_9HYPH|nr:redoxin domain-containing protein [Stappia sediminis]MXN64851.1 redoxin domain-containing protein [Stappia sediminis]
MKLRDAPPLETLCWLNSRSDITLEQLRGKVVMIEAFQMLCPGCVSHGLPQAMRVAETFSPDDVVVLGLHTVFEHHEAQGTRAALEAFLHEYRVKFPVGIDQPSGKGGAPRTMTAYRMQGTPTQILIDRQGKLRKQHFGAEDDLALGAQIMSLLREGDIEAAHAAGKTNTQGENCDENGCRLEP